MKVYVVDGKDGRITAVSEHRPIEVGRRVTMGTTAYLRGRLFWRGQVGMMAGGVLAGLLVALVFPTPPTALAALTAVWGWMTTGWLRFTRRKPTGWAKRSYYVPLDVAFLACTIIAPALVYVVSASGALAAAADALVMVGLFGLVTVVCAATAVKLLADEDDMALLTILIRGERQ